MTTTITHADDLVKFQQLCVTGAIASLKEQSGLPPMICVLTTAAGFSEDARRILRGAGMEALPIAGQHDTADAIHALLFPMDLSPKNIYAQLLLVPGRHGVILPRVLANHQQRGFTDTHDIIIRAFLRMNGGSEEDIQVAFVRSVLKLTGAIAYVRINEARTKRTIPAPDAASPQSDDREVIVVMLETHG